MKAINRKYKRLRGSIQNGDIILVRGKSWLPRIIEWADKAYYSHALVVFKVGDRLLCLQSMASGVEPYYLSTEIGANIDFCILRIEEAPNIINRVLDRVFVKAEYGIPYNFMELPKILLAERFNIKFKNMQGNKRDNICSVFAGHTYASKLCTCYEDAYVKKGYLTPQDLIRYAMLSEIQIIANNPYFI